MYELLPALNGSTESEHVQIAKELKCRYLTGKLNEHLARFIKPLDNIMRDKSTMTL